MHEIRGWQSWACWIVVSIILCIGGLKQPQGRPLCISNVVSSGDDAGRMVGSVL